MQPHQSQLIHDNLVIGAGPAGIALVAELLSNSDNTTTNSIAWIDTSFDGGRLSKYRSVPSNTKEKLFKAFFDHPSMKRDDSITLRHEWNNPEDHCELRYVVEGLREVTKVLRSKTMSIVGSVNDMNYDGQTWFINDASLLAKRVFLATGSHPKEPPFKVEGVTNIPLDEALDNESLKRYVDGVSKVAVIGSSHSAILVLRALSALKVPFMNFYRSDIVYAEYHGDVIVHDNTGLKGIAAEWASTRQWPKEKVEVLDPEHLKGFTHIVWATGFTKNELPRISINKQVISIDDYNSTGQLLSNNHLIPNLYGYGIAFPQRVLDPSGDMEEAVGLYKFAKLFSTRPFEIWR